MAQLSQYTPSMLEVLDKIPNCVKGTVVEAVMNSRCNVDIPCLCRDDTFLKTLVKAILRKCSLTDQDMALHLAQDFCVGSLPSLNDSRQTEIIAIVTIMMVASTVSVILRMVARQMSSAKYGLDDVLIIIALVLTYGLNINELIALPLGFGKHQLMLTLHQMEMFLMNDWSTQIIFACSITATRLSLLLFYHRIFPMQRFRTIAILIGCVLIAWWLSFLLGIIFSCVPVQSFWDRSLDGRCIDENSFSYGITAAELATNVAMLVLPIPWLWSLNLPRSKKLALGGIFMLGSFVCVACVVRFPLLIQLRQTDASWTIVPTGIWVVVECNIGITSVCLPIMRPLFTNHVSHPIRSRFSAFSFSVSKPSTRDSERISDEETPHLSGKTLITSSSTTTTNITTTTTSSNGGNGCFQKPRLPPLSSIHPSKSLPSRHRSAPNRTRNPHGAAVARDDASVSYASLEPWGQNVGARAHRSDSQPWGRNIGQGNGSLGWELDVIPRRPGGAPERGPVSDGRVEKWVGG